MEYFGYGPTTKAQLQTLCDYINDATGHTREEYSQDPDGEYHANPGTFVLHYGGGGVRLAQLCNEGKYRGIRRGITARSTQGQTAQRLRAFLAGIECMKDATESGLPIGTAAIVGVQESRFPNDDFAPMWVDNTPNTIACHTCGHQEQIE